MSPRNNCSECNTPTPRHRFGRPLLTCSDKCRVARNRRRKQEKYQWEAAKRADEANQKYLREDFGPWARGETPP